MKVSPLIKLGLAGSLSLVAGMAMAAPVPVVLSEQTAVQDIQFQQYADWHHRDHVTVRYGDRWDRNDRWERRHDHQRWEHRYRDRVLVVEQGGRRANCVARVGGEWKRGHSYNGATSCNVWMNGVMVRRFNHWHFI